MLLPGDIIGYISAFDSEQNEVKSLVTFVGKEEPDLQRVNHTSLPEHLRKLFYKYDNENAPLSENQLGLWDDVNVLLEYWNVMTVDVSPLSPVPNAVCDIDLESFVTKEVAEPSSKFPVLSNGLRTPEKQKTQNTENAESTCYAPRKKEFKTAHGVQKRRKLIRTRTVKLFE